MTAVLVLALIGLFYFWMTAIQRQRRTYLAFVYQKTVAGFRKRENSEENNRAQCEEIHEEYERASRELKGRWPFLGDCLLDGRTYRFRIAETKLDAANAEGPIRMTVTSFL
jgi:hypothetical protein